MKRFFLVAIATVFFFLQFQINPANAIELTQDTLTIPLNESGSKTVFKAEQYTNGNRLFIQECTQCHLQGKTKTNNNVSLGLSDLAKAEPARDNLLALIDYLENPTSYDGEDDYKELHPNVSRPDIYPELRNWTKQDVEDVAGYMLIAPRLDQRWGGTIYF